MRNAANDGRPVLEPEPISGTPPEGVVRPTIGLLDVAMHPRFAENRFVYVTYNKPGEGDQSALPRASRTSALVLARGVLGGTALPRVEDLYVAPYATGSAWVS